MAELQGASVVVAPDAAARVEFELSLYFRMKLIRAKRTA